MPDELRKELQQAMDDIVRSATVTEYDEAVARYDAIAGKLRERDKQVADAI